MTGEILLDTCAVLWVAAGEISQKAAIALTQSRDAGLMTYVSPITAWEIGILSRRGRFKSSYSPQRWFARLMETPATALAALSPEVLLESSFLPGQIGEDLADRIIAATAREYGFTVMTRDRVLLDYAAQGYLSAMEC